MRRRALLASIAVLAGCSSGSPATGAEPTATDPGSDSLTDDPDPLPVGRVVRRPSIRYFRNDDAIGVDRPGRDQFVYVHVTNDESAGWSDHALRLDDRTFDPVEPRGFMLSVPGTGDYYEDGAGWLVFDVPAMSVDEAGLVAGSEERSLADEALQWFTQTPELTVRSVSVPERVGLAEDVVTSIEVENAGEREGLFLAGIRTGGYPRSLTTSVSVGETVTLTGRLPAPEDAGEMRLVVSLPGDDRSYEIRVEATPTPTDG